MKLSNKMARLVERAKQLLRDGWSNRQYTDLHSDVCVALANEFDVWEPDELGAGFPLWLSRVVEGELRDLEFERGEK